MKHFIPIFLFLLTLNSCVHDPPTEPVGCEIDGEIFTREKSIQQMKDYLLFDVGTWWIYEEETSGALDTVEVYYSWEGIAQEVNEAFRMDTHSSYYDFNFYYTLNSSFGTECITSQSCFCFPCKRVKTKPGNFVGESNNFLFPPKKHNFIYVLGGGVIEVEDIFASDTINNQIFESLVVFRTDNNLSEDDQETRFWVSENIGIVRKELIDDNQIWNLIEYNIIN